MCVGIRALIFFYADSREELSLIALSTDKQEKKSINILIIGASRLCKTREIAVCSLITELQRTSSAAKIIHCNYQILKCLFNT